MSQDSSEESSGDEEAVPLLKKKKKLRPPLDDEEHDIANRLFQDTLDNGGPVQTSADIMSAEDNIEGGGEGDAQGEGDAEEDNEDRYTGQPGIGHSIFDDNGVFFFSCSIKINTYSYLLVGR